VNLKNPAFSEEPEDSNAQENRVTLNDVVKMLISYDIGCSTGGSERHYGSLNGFGAVIGNPSGMD
jgi:hypothetical protein